MGAWLPVRAFDLYEPGTVQEAIDLLNSSDNAVIMGGGAVLTFLIQQRLAAPGRVIDVTRIPVLHGISEQDGRLHIRASTTVREIERSALVRKRLPVLAEAARLVGNVRVRNVATLGGHIAQADVHQDLPPVLTALGAEIELTGPSGVRALAISDFLLGYYETALAPGEMITGASIPIPSEDLQGVYLKYCAISQHDWPTLGVCAFMENAGGRPQHVRVVAGAVSDRPLRVVEAEALLENEGLQATVLAEVANRYARAADPVEDARGSAAYKRHVTGVYVRRALQAAAGRAGVPL